MNKLVGNITDRHIIDKVDVIVHGCNCFHLTDSDTGSEIKKAFPEAHLADMQTEKGDDSKLGKASIVDFGNVIIVNGYTRYSWWPDGIANEYQIRKLFHFLNCCLNKNRVIAYTSIGWGCNWETTSKVIEEEFEFREHYLVTKK